MTQIYYILLGFFVYGFLGWCAEVAFAAVKEKEFVNRGFLNGPICPIYGVGVISVVEILQPVADKLVLLYLTSVVLTTALEWITGFLMEKLFHHKWWDYSNMPMNLNGYVCVPFSFVWGLACVVIVRNIHPFIYRLLTMLPLGLGVTCVIVLSVVLIVDLSVTVAGILKLNRRLEAMEEIARELKNLSDQIGSSISKNVLDGLEKQEDTIQKVEDTLVYLKSGKEERKSQAVALIEERRMKIHKLKSKYQELLEERSALDRRLLRAFPTMKPRRYETQFHEVKDAWMRHRSKIKEKREAD